MHRESNTEWLDSFNGEAIWPALPLPPVEEYEADLALRFNKLKVCCHLVSGCNASSSQC